MVVCLTTTVFSLQPKIENSSLIKPLEGHWVGTIV